MIDKKVVRIVFGINFLGIIFICWTLSSYIFGFRLTRQKYANYTVGYEMLPDTTVRNVTYYTKGKQGNITRERVNNVAFLKVHKAGSTTMQNLFFRFGIRHNLNILLPKTGNHLYEMTQVIPLKPPQTYNIFACHTVYSKTFFDQLIPTGSVKIGIVREPVDRLISAAYYYRDVWHFKYLDRIPQADFIHNLLNHQNIYDTSFFSATHNKMGQDFGFPRKIKSTDKDRIDSYLHRLNSEFVLVMVVEKFDKSLIMMKRYLSWSFLDIIYLKTNSHEHTPVVLNKHEQANVRETNFLDFAIYEYFTKIFDEKLESMSDDFDEEVHYFKHLLNEVHAFCSQAKLQDDSKLFVNQSYWEKEFTVLGKECSLMTTGELSFIDNIRKKKQ